jgi:hypothetical protein
MPASFCSESATPASTCSAQYTCKISM